ncbi:putative C2H2-type domain-containing protein [Seiridium cardinale]
MASAQRNDNDIPGVAHTQGIGISMSPPPATVGNIMETIDSDTTNRLFPTDPSHHDDLYRTISKPGSTVPPLQSPEGPNTPPVKSVPANIRLSEPNSKTLSPLLKLTSSRDSHPRLKVQAPDEQSPSSGPVLLSPGATALHPFGRPPPQSQQGDNIDTPLSPLPSHLLNRGFLPSPSLLFPEWILSNNDNNIMPPKLEPEQFYVPYDILNTQIDPNMFKSTGDVTITHVPMPAPVAPIHKELFYQYVSSLGYNVAGSTTETEAAKRSQSSPNETPATDKLHHLDPLERRVMENDRPWIPKSIALPRVQNAANVRDHGYASQKFYREDPPPSRSRRIPPVVVMPALSYGSHGTEQRISSAAASYEDAVGYRDAQSLAEKSNSSRGTTQCAQHPSPAPIPMHENGPARQRNLRKLEQPTTALVKPRDTSPSSGWPPISGSESRQAKKLMSRLSDELLEQIEVGNNAMKERKADNPAELDYEPTDSGYASVPNLQRPLVNVNVSGKLTGQRFETTQIANCDDRSDAGTVLSAATSAIPELVHDSITQICEDIYNHLHFNTDTENHRSIIDSLPELIKAFAIRLGADSTQKMSSGIMHFVYKHHNKICAVLSRKLVEDDNHWSGISDTNKEAMSLADKISLWERGQQYDAIDQSDRFKGVVDLEDDELLSTAELSVYSKAILESRAYEWLLSTMRNKVVLEWGNSLNAINKTRQAVLLMLRPGTISSKKAPKPFTTTMILPGCWQSFVAKLWEAFLPDIQVVNVLNDTDCQLTNMEQYVNKVWPEFGSLVLYAFQRLLKDVPLASGTGTITVATRLLHDCDIRTIPTPKSRPGGSDSSNASAQISGSSTSTAQTQNITIPPRSSLKRKSYERENNDDDDLPEKRPRVGSKSAADTQSKSFACPYWKADPIMHRLCFQLKLLTSSRVKQHLGRVHSPRFYCQICYLTFRDTQTQDAHVTQRRCQREPGASLDGLLPEQHFQLSRKPKLTLSEKEKWFRIWEIVFPGRKRPHSPYIDRRLTDCCATFREHWQNRGLDILNQELRDSNIISIDGVDEETRRQALQAVLTRGFDLIVESWTPPVTSQDITPLIESAMIELPTGTGPQIPPFPIFPSFAASTTPASSFVDSAVGLGGDVAPTITTRSHSSNAGFPPYADVFANENSIMDGVASMPSQNTQRITDAQLVSTSESSSINDPSHDFSFEMPDFNEEFWTTSDHRFHNDEA